MLSKFINSFLDKNSPLTVHAHCDGPCGVYDPASTRVAAEAVLSMTKKLIALEAPLALIQRSGLHTVIHFLDMLLLRKSKQKKQRKKF